MSNIGNKMKLFGLMGLLLMLATSVNANVFSNMVNHPDKPGLTYSFSEGVFNTLIANEDGWHVQDRILIDSRYDVPESIVLYDDGSGAIVAKQNRVSFIPFNEDGFSNGEFHVLLNLPDTFNNYQIKISSRHNLILVMGETYLVQYEIIENEAIEVGQYSVADFVLPNPFRSHLHPDGTIIDFSGRVYPWNGTNYTAPVTIARLAEMDYSDKLILDENDGLIVVEAYEGNLLQFNWPLTEEASGEVIASNWGWQQYGYRGISSDSSIVLAQSTPFNAWIFDPNDPTAYNNINYDYPHWLKSYHDIVDEHVFEFRPVLVDGVLWLGPLKIEQDGTDYRFDYFNPLSLSNFDLLLGGHGSSRWVNELQQLSSELAIGLSRYSLNNDGQIEAKTVLETQSQGEWAQFIMAEPLAENVFTLVLNPNNNQLYAQIYQGDELLSEFPVYNPGYFDGRPIYRGSSRPVISGNNYVYFEVFHKLFYCHIAQLEVISDCRQIEVEELIYPNIAAYKDGIIYWGSHRSRFITISHVDDELRVEEKWSEHFDEDCCVEKVFYNPLTDRLFVDDKELLADGRVAELSVDFKIPHFYNPNTGVAFGPGQSSGTAFGYKPNNDRYFQVEFNHYLYPEVGEYFFRAYLNNDLLVFDDRDSLTGIRVIKTPFLVNLDVDFNESEHIYSYEELIIPTSNVFTSEPDSSEIWLHAAGYDTVDQKNAVPYDDNIVFKINKEFSLEHDGSFPFSLAVEQGAWQVTLPLKTQLLNLNEAPVFDVVSEQVMAVADEYGGELLDIVTDIDGDTLSFTAEGLPPGLTLNGSYISGSPENSGSYVVIITATDPAGLSAQTQFKILVNEATLNLSNGGSSGGSLGYWFSIMLFGFRYFTFKYRFN